jgi:glycosyltransferase involved in cell wall biosynthesis
VSEHAKLGVQEHFRVAPGKIRVTHEAAARTFQPIESRAVIDASLARLGITAGTRYIVYFGGLTPHKNVSLLIDVFAKMRQDVCHADVRLVLAGDYTRDVYYSAYAALQAQVEACCPGAAIFTGHVADCDAACLLNGALVCVLPSLDEGFGLPGIEAAACGAPLIATRNSAMPQWLGDAALYFEPTNASELRTLLDRVLRDKELRQYMHEQGIVRAGQLSWESAAQQVMNVFDEL